MELLDVRIIWISDIRVATDFVSTFLVDVFAIIITSLVKLSSLLVTLLPGALHLDVDLLWVHDRWSWVRLVVTELDLVSDLALVLCGGGSVLVSWVGRGSGFSLGGWVLCELLGDLSWLGVVGLL